MLLNEHENPKAGCADAVRKYRLKLELRRGKPIPPAKAARMSERYEQQAAMLDMVRRVAWQAIEALYPPQCLKMAYLSFATQVYSWAGRVSGETLRNELALLADHWHGRGLDRELLRLVEDAVLHALEDAHPGA